MKRSPKPSGNKKIMKRQNKKRSPKLIEDYKNKKRSPKLSVKQTTGLKKSPRRVLKTNIELKGMGNVLQMYGQRGGSAETRLNQLLLQIKQIDKKLLTETDQLKRRQLQTLKLNLSGQFQKLKSQLKMLLLGAAKTANTAAHGLSKVIGDNLEIGNKALERSIKERISSIKKTMIK